MVYGQHDFNKTLESVKFLEIQDENLIFLPPNLSLFFPNLTGITIKNSKLQKLDSRDLQPFYELSLLRVTNNPITSLDAELLRYNPNLRVIDFSNNKIRAVGRNLLLTLPSAVSVYFAKNDCVNENALNPVDILRLNIKLPKLCPMPEVSFPTTVKIEENLSFEQ